MKIAELLADRRAQWQELDRLCAQLEDGRRRRLAGATVSRFAALYRSALRRPGVVGSVSFAAHHRAVFAPIGGTRA